MKGMINIMMNTQNLLMINMMIWIIMMIIFDFFVKIYKNFYFLINKTIQNHQNKN